jgi:SAM-dependent methyltransferase
MTHDIGSRPEDRVDREREFHDLRYSGSARARIDSYYSLLTAGSEYYEDAVRAQCRGARVLEYGCGEGRFAAELAALGAYVHAIDISEVAVETARRRAAERLLSVKFRLMNAEKLEYADGTFDLICGRSILHHLNLDAALSEVHRTLRPGGRAIFLEPLGDNPALRLLRAMTPRLRSADEHPLQRRDIERASIRLELLDARYFHLASLLAVPFQRVPGVAGVVDALDAFDELLFRTPLRHFAWVVVMTLARPRGPDPGP